MALSNNTPTLSYVKWSRLCIYFDDKVYQIKDNATNLKYIYWSVENPNVLRATNRIENNLAYGTYLIFMNENGSAAEIPNDEITLSWDGDVTREIAKQVFALHEQNKVDGEKFVAIETDINGIKTIVGDSENPEPNTILDKISKIEQSTEEISGEVSSVRKDFNDNKELNNLRDNVSKAMVDYNSTLGVFSNEMNTYVRDEKINEEENTSIENHIKILNSKKDLVVSQVDLVLLLLESQNLTNDYKKVDDVKKDFIKRHEELISYIETSILDKIIVPSEITLITSNFGKASTAIRLLNTTIDDIMLLGIGGVLTEALARIGMTTDGIRLSYSKLETKMKNNLSLEKADLQRQIEDVLSKFENLQITCSESFEDGKIDAAEQELIDLKISELEVEMSDIAKKYDKYYTDINLSEEGKINLKQDYDKYISKYNELKAKIIEVISDGFANDAEKNQIDIVITEYQTQMNIMHNRMCLSIDIIESNKFNAEIKKMKDDLQKEIDDVNKKVDDLDFTIDGTFANNIIDKTERENIKQNLDTLLREKTDVDNQYKYWYNNVFLDGTLKTQYKASYDLYTSKYNALVKLMNDILGKTELVNDTDKANLSKANKELLTAIEKFVTDTEKVIDYVNQKAVEKAKSDLHKEIGDVNTSVGDLNDYIDGTFKDNVFDKSEKESIKQNLNNLSREKADVDSQYEKLYSNANLDGTLKTQYKASHDDYVSKYNNLVLVINNIVNKVEFINDTDRANLDNANALLNGSIKVFVGKSNEVIDYINKKEVSKAKTELSGEIGDVQGSLKDLNDEINGAFKDGILDSIEISAIEEQLRLLNKEKLDVDGQFTEVYNNKDLI